MSDAHDLVDQMRFLSPLVSIQMRGILPLLQENLKNFFFLNIWKNIVASPNSHDLYINEKQPLDRPKKFPPTSWKKLNQVCWLRIKNLLGQCDSLRIGQKGMGGSFSDDLFSTSLDQW